MKDYDSHKLGVNSIWTSEGDCIDQTKLKDLNSNNSLVTIGGILS